MDNQKKGVKLMKTKKLKDSETGENLFALVSLREKEPDEFAKVFVDSLYNLCKSPEFGSLPLAAFAWILRHVAPSGQVMQSQAHYSRYRNCSSVTAWKQFRLLCAAEVLVPTEKIGSIQTYICNPNVVSKTTPDARKKATRRFDGALVQETLFGTKKTSPRANKPNSSKPKNQKPSPKK
jgi:hypothetical protein